MQIVTKPYIYKLLDQIRAEKQLDVSSYVSAVVASENIPYEVIVFVNKHIPIDQLTTYNAIYNKRNNSRLFRNIVKDNLSVEDKAIVLSSILNQSLISIKHDTTLEKNYLTTAVNIKLILDALDSYMFDDNIAVIEECFEMFRTIFKTLFPR